MSQAGIKPITFDRGILGLEDCKNYIIVQDQDSFLYYLQSQDDTNIEFVIISPHVFVETYEPLIAESYLEEIGGGDDENFAVYLIVKLAKEMNDITVNLQAPILIHLETYKGVQVIIEDNKYSIRANLAKLIKGDDKNVSTNS